LAASVRLGNPKALKTINVVTISHKGVFAVIDQAMDVTLGCNYSSYPHFLTSQVRNFKLCPKIHFENKEKYAMSQGAC